jgi:hypothetical protein
LLSSTVVALASLAELSELPLLDARESVLYQPPPLKITAVGTGIRRAWRPQSSQSCSVGAEKLSRRSYW